MLSAFSGVGGLDLGLERAGFTTVGFIENDRHARAALEANPRGTRRWRPLPEGDIGEVAASLVPRDLGLRPRQLAILAGGPPCQPFSKAAQWAEGSRSGLSDDRGRCVGAFFDLAESFLPRAILIENVQGYVQGETSALGYVRRRLDRVNRLHGTRYRAMPRVLDAVDYGVPQRRRRAIIVALRDGADFEWPEPTHAQLPVRAWDAIGRLSIRETPETRGRFRTLLPAVPEGENYLYFTDRGACRHKLFGYRTRYWSFLLKLAKAEPAWTLAANPGPSIGPFHWDSRPLAPEEMLRLQSFPLSWRLSGSYRDQVRQAGNATPPLLAEVLGRALGEQLLGLTYSNPPSLRIPRCRDEIPPPERRRPVPAAFRRLHGSHVAHPGAGLGPQPRLHIDN